MSDKNIVEPQTVFPNRGNLWTVIIIFGGMTLTAIVLGLYKGILFSTNIWAISLIPLIPLIWMYFFIKAQTVVLGEDTITHTKLGFRGVERKAFNFSELEYWKYEQLSMLVVTKGNKPPELPHGPFEDISKVLIIPASLFAPNTQIIADYLIAKGVAKK